MRIKARPMLYRKIDLLRLIGFDDYRLLRKLLSEDIAQKTGYDQKHTFTEHEKDLIVFWFRKSA